MSVVREARYIDDKARICEETLLVLFSGGFAALSLLGSRAVIPCDGLWIPQQFRLCAEAFAQRV